MMGFFQPSIDILGHAGGLVGGYLSARMVGMPGARRPAPGRVLCGVLLFILIGGCIALGYLL
jgi:rhomboid protease GluP